MAKYSKLIELIQDDSVAKVVGSFAYKTITKSGVQMRIENYGAFGGNFRISGDLRRSNADIPSFSFEVDENGRMYDINCSTNTFESAKNVEAFGNLVGRTIPAEVIKLLDQATALAEKTAVKPKKIWKSI